MLGRAAFKMATLTMPPYIGRTGLANVGKVGFISPSAKIYGENIKFGRNIFIDDNVIIYQSMKSGPISFGDNVHILRDTIIQTGKGGRLTIGERTFIQPRCQISAYISSLHIGTDVQIAPYCSFYPYSHSIKPGIPIHKQNLQSKGGIVIENDVWLGVGVTILDGVHIGEGAVIAAGSVVNKSLPAESIAAGIPAKIIKMR
jgi:acetyltransferase-like isoleucine patch superfamily enzyme